MYIADLKLLLKLCYNLITQRSMVSLIHSHNLVYIRLAAITRPVMQLMLPDHQAIERRKLRGLVSIYR